MELDELKAAWHELDRRLDANQQINLQVFKDLKLDGMRTELRRLSFLLSCELLSGVLATLLLGSFLVEHLGTARFAVPAVVLHAVAVFTIGAAAWQLVRIGRLDYAGPVVTLQHALAELRSERVRMSRRLLLLAPLLWTPLAIVAAQGLFGFDVFRGFGPVWVASNLAFGLATIPLAIWASRRFAERLGGSRFVKHLADDIAGRSLVTAQVQLEKIARFEAE